VGGGLAGALTVTWFASAWTVGAALVGTALVFGMLAVAGAALDGRRVERVQGVAAQVAVALEVLAGGARGPVWHAGRAVRALTSSQLQ
jgi:hypothetical protein